MDHRWEMARTQKIQKLEKLRSEFAEKREDAEFPSEIRADLDEICEKLQNGNMGEELGRKDSKIRGM